MPNNSIYLSEFNVATETDENIYMRGGHSAMTCYASHYPFGLFPPKGLESLSFENVTILYGSNGSGKSTLLNLIAAKLGILHNSPFNDAPFLQDYLNFCYCKKTPFFRLKNSFIITSDDIFNYMFLSRMDNDEMHYKANDLENEYYAERDSRNKIKSIDFSNSESVSAFQRSVFAKRSSLSAYIRNSIYKDEKLCSNGETALAYFSRSILPEGLYLLDEPENSLSPTYQLDLLTILQGLSRFEKCQFIIATHSPFILSFPFAKIYDLDTTPVSVKKWTELENVRLYYDFFKEHENEF